MANVELTASVDTSGLRKAIPEIVAFGRRTMLEQCVTSAAYICRNAMELTPATPLSRINADMQATLSPAVNKNGSLSRNKRKQQAVVNLPDRSAADMIVIARMHPQSKFNQITGGRWKLERPAFSAAKFTRAYGESGGAMAKEQFWNWVREKAVRMVKSRRSSANYLKSGWKAAIRKLFAHPDFKGKQRRGNYKSLVNPLNTLNNDMGDIDVRRTLDEVNVMASNDVGLAYGQSNPILAEKHRAALIRHGLPAAQTACLMEEQSIKGEVERRLAEGWERINKQLA